ncbi:hypothetical protein BpHYR1_052941 [Brachionus plicatilis]|uniref:Uncharacterized protein n=1 Tax=Brachionus plicatilis TaxID=10195 RepID=A0A3M7RT41_BRAPC|nr:hypothetical protein BpHYR1_052941 [Brachionus plicatilis]
MEKIEYFDLKKCIILFDNYKLHKVASNADGSVRFRCQTCKSISVTVDKTDLIFRKPNASFRHLSQCKKYFKIQTICMKKYEEIKHDARTEPSLSFSKSYGKKRLSIHPFLIALKTTMSTKIALYEKFSSFAEFDEEFKIYCDNKFEIFSKAASRFVKDEPSQYEYVEYKCLQWRKP